MMHSISPPSEQASTEQAPTSRRLKACENCRQRKIKCPGPADGLGDKTCISCHRSNKTCIFRPKTVVKRRKRVESRMRELEQSILELSTHLQNVRTYAPTATRKPPQHSPRPTDDTDPLSEDARSDDMALAEHWSLRNDSQSAALATTNHVSPATYNSAPTPPDQYREPTLSLRFKQFFSSLETIGPILGLDASSLDAGATRLLIHWEKEAINTFGPPHLQAAFRKWGFDLASQAPFLLHAMCAFAALHLKELHGDVDAAIHQTLDQLFDHHFRLGLNLYSSELSRPVVPQAMDALFAGCMLFALIAYATNGHETRNRVSDSCLESSSVNGLAWLTSQTGFTVIKESPVLRPYLSQSIWHTLLDESRFHADQFSAPLDICKVSSDWLTLCQISKQDSNEDNPYICALKYLAHTRDIDPVKSENFSYFICFPGHMTPHFKELITKKDNIALLLLSHWLAKMYAMGHWWSRDCMLDECEAICERLGRECASDPVVLRLLVTPRRVCRAY